MSRCERHFLVFPALHRFQPFAHPFRKFRQLEEFVSWGDDGFPYPCVIFGNEVHGPADDFHFPVIGDASFTCHMPDCLEMPYKPVIRGAIEPEEGKPVYRIGGDSCLSGDYMGDWFFEQPLKVGDKLIFEDMIHYTIVKTTMFNGIPHPSLALWSKEDRLVMYKEFGYEDYKGRMD